MFTGLKNLGPQGPPDLPSRAGPSPLSTSTGGASGAVGSGPRGLSHVARSGKRTAADMATREPLVSLRASPRNEVEHVQQAELVSWAAGAGAKGTAGVRVSGRDHRAAGEAGQPGCRSWVTGRGGLRMELQSTPVVVYRMH